MAPWMPAKYLPAWMIINGIITEYLRRVNAVPKTLTVNDGNGGANKELKFLKPAPLTIPKGLVVVKEEDDKK